MLEDKVLDSAGNLADSLDMTNTHTQVSPARQCAQANDQLFAAMETGDRDAILDALQVRLDLRDRYPDVSLTDVVCARFLLCREAHLEGRLTCHG